ncbi:MAG: hypothetical protein JRI96_05500 [Deltaproteobacteria bacterium]|nr:hypothetical protein [Deltaproteobacteria bacterium]
MKNVGAKSILEKISIVVGIICGIAALAFSSYQAYLLRYDFKMRMRPIVEISFGGRQVIEKRFLGVFFPTRDEYYVYFDEEKEMPHITTVLEFTNYGDYPAKIKGFGISFAKSIDGDRYSMIFYDKKKAVDYPMFILPHESISFAIDTDFVFEENISAEASELLRGGEYFWFMKVYYTFFSEKLDDEIYHSEKVFAIENGAKKVMAVSSTVY